MNQYVKRDIQRAFDYLKIANDDLSEQASKLHLKGGDRNNTKADKLLDAKVKIVEAIELLSEANIL